MAESFLDPERSDNDPDDLDGSIDAALDQKIAASLKRSFQPPQSPDLSFLKTFADRGSPQPGQAGASETSLASSDLASDFHSPEMAESSANTTRNPDHFSSDHSFGLSTDAQERTSRRRRTRLAGVGLAAAIAWIAVGVQFYLTERAEPIRVAYQPRPLTNVFKECVDGGFEPYWVCDNDRLFASTFETRQGVPLKLIGLPDHSRMVGLSYLAGVSPTSTSLLAMAGDEPVIVFVDRVDRDREIPTGFFEDEGIQVFRFVRDGLVFYEVSRQDEAKIAPYLVPWRE